MNISEVLSSNFEDLAASVTSTASTTLMASMTFTFIKKNILMVGSSLASKWPILVPFCRLFHQKSNFSLILAPFRSEAAFKNLLMKLKCPNLLKPLGIQKQNKLLTFRAIYNLAFQYETPCRRHFVIKTSREITGTYMKIQLTISLS